METKLMKKKQLKNATKHNPYKRIRVIQDSSPDSPQVRRQRTNNKQQRHRCIVSSDSDADLD
jgi:hypothetical protein